MRRVLVVLLLAMACGPEPTDPVAGLTPLIVMGDGQQGTVGTQLAQPLIVQAIDSRGRPARRLDVRWQVTSGGGHPSIDVTQTDQNGNTFNHWTLGTTAGQAQRLEARVISTNELLGAFSATAVSGPPAQLSLSAGNGQSAVHGTNVAIRPAVRVTDQYGNPAYGSTVTFTVTSGGGSVSGATQTPDANGIAAVGGWTLGPTPGQNTLAATASGLSGSPVTFTATATVGGVSAAQSTVSATPNSVQASAGAVSSTVIVTARDASGFPISGATVTFAATGAGNTLVQPAAPTDENGVTQGTLSSTAAGMKTVSATANGVAIAQTAAVTVTSAAVATMVANSGDNQSAERGVPVTIPPSVLIQDAFGNPVPGVAVTFAITSGGGSITGSNPAVTSSSGIAAVGGWTLGSTPGANTLTATASGLSPITFTATATVGVVSATQSTVSASPSSINTSTGAVTSTITVTARDASGFPVSGRAVTLAATGTGVVLTQPTGPTDANGVATGTLSASAAGSKTVSATIDQTAVTQTAVVTVTVAPVSVALSTVAANPDTIIAGSGSSTITVTARNTDGQPIIGSTVTLAVTGTGWTNVTQPPTATDANGVTTGLVSQACLRGPKVVTATIGGTALTPDTVYVVPGAPGWVTTSIGPQRAPVGTAVPIRPTVFVEDSCGNPVEGIPVEFAVTGGGGTIAGGSVVATDNSGHAALGAWTLGPMEGPNTLTATIPGSAGNGVIGNPVTFTATGELGYWTRIAELPTRRFLLAAAGLSGKVYAVGGVDYDPMATVEAYDPAAGTWSSRAPMPTARYGPGVGGINGVLYAVGGTGTGNTGGENEAYDPVTDTWTTKAEMPTRRVTPGVAVVNGILYAIGGQGCPAGTPPPCGQALATVEAYDPVTDTWTTKASMPTARWGLGVATVNGIIYAVGGTGTDNVQGLNAVEAYDPASDTWTTRAPLPDPTWGLAVAGGDGVVYAVGGYVYDPASNYVNATANLWLYDPSTDRWRVGAVMAIPRSYLAAAFLDGLMYVVGPENGSGGSAEVYHP